MSDRVWESEAAPYLTPSQPGEADAWTRDAPRRHTQRLLEVVETEPPAAVAAALGIGTGERAVVRRRVMYDADTAVELTDSWYRASLATGTQLAEHRKIKGGTVTLLAQLGHAIAEVIEDVSAAMLPPEVRERYALHAEDPVLALTRVSLGVDGQPVEVSVMHMLRGQHLTYRARV